MIKQLLPGLLTLLLTSCATQDEQYFRTHPQKLQEALVSCPNTPPKAISCQQLQLIAVEVNKLVFEMQISPQRFGTKIIALQSELSETQTDAAKDTIRQKLAMRLAVVRWLQSPEG